MTRVWIKTALGVASWILPRPGSTVWHGRLGWASYGLLNGGLGLVALTRILDLIDVSKPGLVGVGYALMLAGALAFIGSVSHRVGFVPSHVR